MARLRLHTHHVCAVQQIYYNLGDNPRLRIDFDAVEIYDGTNGIVLALDEQKVRLQCITHFWIRSCDTLVCGVLWHDRDCTPIMCCSNTLHNGDNTRLWLDCFCFCWDYFWCCWNIYATIYCVGFGRAGGTFAIVSFWIRKRYYLLGVECTSYYMANIHPCAVQIHYNGNNTRLYIDFDVVEIHETLALDEQDVWCNA